MICQIETLAIMTKDRSNSRSVAISSCDPLMDRAEQGDSIGGLWDSSLLVRIQHLHHNRL